MFWSFATIVALGRIDYISLKWNSSCRRHDMYENEQLQFNEPYISSLVWASFFCLSNKEEQLSKHSKLS